MVGCFVGADLTHYQPIEQIPQSRQTLFHRRRGQRLRLLLNPGGHMQWAYGEQIWYAHDVAPGQELVHGARIGPPCVRVANLGREKL